MMSRFTSDHACARSPGSVRSFAASILSLSSGTSISVVWRVDARDLLVVAAGLGRPADVAEVDAGVAVGDGGRERPLDRVRIDAVVGRAAGEELLGDARLARRTARPARRAPARS